MPLQCKTGVLQLPAELESDARHGVATGALNPIRVSQRIRDGLVFEFEFFEFEIEFLTSVPFYAMALCPAGARHGCCNWNREPHPDQPEGR